MYKKSVPILAALIIFGGIQHIQAGDYLAAYYAGYYLPVYHQQEELACAVCQENLDDAVFLVCNNHLLVIHTECMQERMVAGDLDCPVCSQELSEENVDAILSSLTGGDVVVLQAVDEEPVAQGNAPNIDVALDIDDDQVVQWIADSLEFYADEVEAERVQRELSAQVVAQQMQQDEDLAHQLSGQDQPVQQVQEQPQQNGGDNIQQAQSVPENWDMCNICLSDDYQQNIGRLLPCGHLYHMHCINPWLTNHNDCPTCRTVVNSLEALPPVH